MGRDVALEIGAQAVAKQRSDAAPRISAHYERVDHPHDGLYPRRRALIRREAMGGST